VTLNVRTGAARAAPRLPGGTPGAGFVYTPIALVPLSTTTPRESGAVIHEVGYGQSLWAIAVAYGVTGDRIRELNGMAPGQTDIYAGQKLLIIPAGMYTPVPSATATAGAVTSSPQPVAMLATPTPRLTATRVHALTATPTPPTTPGAALKIDPVLAGLIGMATLGLILVLSSSIKIKRGD
jgi:LysM repeat protein